MTNQKRIVNEILDEDKQKDNVVAICVFGSVAFDKERPDSDVDIQVVYDNNHEWELFKEKRYGIKIDYEIVTTKIIEMLIEKYPYLSYNLLYTNKILYDPQGFMKKVQEKLKQYYDSHPEVKEFWDNENKLMRELKNQALKPKNFIEICDEAEIKFSGYNEIRRNILNKEFFKKHLKGKK
jgi:predicted nucleotidyltransferase